MSTNYLVDANTGNIIEYTDEIDLIIVEVMQQVGTFKGEFIFDINTGLDYTFFELSPDIMDYQMTLLVASYNRFFDKPIEWAFTLNKHLNAIRVNIALMFHVKQQTIQKNLDFQVYKGI